MLTATKAKRPTVRRRVLKPTPTPAPVTKSRFIFKHDVLDRLGGISSVTLWRYCKEKKFPLPIALCGKSAWREDDVEAWIAARPFTMKVEA